MGHCCFIGSCEQCETQKRVVLKYTRGYGGFFTCNPGERPVLRYTCRERVGLVIEGATTPWSWASLPGLFSDRTRDRFWRYSGGVFRVYAGRAALAAVYQASPVDAPWVVSERIPEPLSPEARALVASARGGK